MKTLETANKLKDTIIFINEDFSRAAMDITKKLWERVKELKKNGKHAFLKYDFFPNLAHQGKFDIFEHSLFSYYYT